MGKQMERLKCYLMGNSFKDQRKYDESIQDSTEKLKHTEMVFEGTINGLSLNRGCYGKRRWSIVGVTNMKANI